MPTITIEVPDTGGITAPAPGGAVYLPKRELRVGVYLGTERVMRPAVFDTGALATALPQRVWTKLDQRGDIAWLGPRVAGRTMAVAGGRYPFRLGRVRLKLVDLFAELAPRDVIAICTDDPQALPPHQQLPILVGLADVMHGRSLHLEASPDGQRWAANLTEP